MTDDVVVELCRHAELRPVRGSDALVTASVGPDNVAVVVWATQDGRDALRSRTEQPGWASFPDPAPPVPTSAYLMTMDATSSASCVVLADLPVAHPFVQPLPGGRTLVVGARCRWRPEGPDRNAVIYDGNGAILRRATLGDGIKHVFTTSSGMTWVGYSDEGVYGNYGWDRPGPPAIGATGIVRFDADLEPDWRYTPPDGAGWISDCYALNVIGETAWSTYYTDFPVVRIADSLVTSWTGPGTTARALITAGTQCALIDGTGQPRILVGDLNHGHFQRRLLSLPAGQRVPRGARFVARGPDLHVLTDTTWYRLALEDLR